MTPRSRRRKRYLAAWTTLQGGCYLCGKPGKLKSIEHVRPKFLGGSDRMTNKLGACTRCNNLKGHRPPHPCELIYLNSFYLVHGEKFKKLAGIL